MKLMKKGTRNVCFVLFVVAVLAFVLVPFGMMVEGDTTVDIRYSDKAGTVAVDPSKLGIDVGSSVTLLILRPGADANAITAADIVWVDQKAVEVADSLSFAFKFRSAPAGDYIVKLGGTGADPILAGFTVTDWGG